MTLQEAIATVQDLKPSQYKQPHFIRWISDVDGIIWNEIMKTHDAASTMSFDGYSENTDMSIVLLAPDPYSVLYVDYLCAMIDFYNGEFTRYNNQMIKYNNSYQTFVDYWNRTHMPVGKSQFKL